MFIGRSNSALGVAVFALFGAAACTPAKAPGTNPEDMTPEEHRAAAQAEQEKAAEHEQQKQDVTPSKPMMEDTQKAQQEQKAQTHRKYSEQHEQAAEAAEQKGGPSSTYK